MPTNDNDCEQLKSRPIADALHQWLTLQRQEATDGTSIAKAIDYSLNDGRH